jgi:hypothetical protein
MAAHMGVSDFFSEKVVHRGGTQKSYETVLRPGFGQFLSPILQPRERREDVSSRAMLRMKDMVDEGLSHNTVKGNHIRFRISHPELKTSGGALRACVETLACCKIITHRHGVLCFDDPVSKSPVAISDLTVFDPSAYSPKRLHDVLGITVPKGYEEEFHDSIAIFKQRLQHFLNFNFGKEIDIYKNSPSTGKAPKKGICACEVCKKKTKNAPHKTDWDNVITNHHILPTRYGGSNDLHFITNICVPCHNHGNGVERLINYFDDSVRKIRLGTQVSLFFRKSQYGADEISRALAHNPYPKAYAVDYLNLYSNAVSLAMLCTYFQQDTLITINLMARDRLIFSIAPMVLDLWQ